jgi:hypothetical protein
VSEVEPLEQICAGTLLEHFKKSFGYGDEPAAGEDIPDLIQVYLARRGAGKHEYTLPCPA